MDSIFEREALPQLQAVTSFARKLCKDDHRAKDLTQETMLKAFICADRYREGSNCRAWLFQICKNTFINDYRRRQYEPLAVEFQEQPDDGQASSRSNISRVAGRNLVNDDHQAEWTDSLGDEVTTALAAIPPDYQTAIVLCDIEGYTYEEIAELMDTPIGTIRSRIHRGRKMLTVLLSGYANEMGFSRSVPQLSAG